MNSLRTKPKTGEIVIGYNGEIKIKPICIKRVMGKRRKLVPKRRRKNG